MDRKRRSNRMERLRIVVYLVLVLASHIHVTKPMMQEHRPKRRQDEWSNAVSRREEHSNAGVSKSERDSNVQAPHLEIRSNKAVLGVPKKFEKQLIFDRHSNQLEQSGDARSVQDCPSYCECRLVRTGNQTALFVQDCKYDPIDALPKLFNSHGDITQVSLVNCQLSSLPLEIEKLPLVVVTLAMNRFTHMPQELWELPQLVYLDMKYNKLSSLPANLTHWSTLKELDVSFNMISELPEGMGGMRNLFNLNLTQNELQALPRDIGAMSELQILYISYNKLEALPQSLGALSQLEILDVSYNQLQSLPQSIGALSQLQYMYINHNQLQLLPGSIGALSQLWGLYSSYNKLKSLPPELGNLTQLQYLDLSNNQLKTIPSELGRLPALLILYLDGNELTVLPDEIYNLKHLIDVHLSNNPLGQIPALSTDTLLCDNCSIQTLPCELFTKGHITQLGLSNNAIRSFGCTDPCFQTGLLDLSYNLLQELPCGYFMGGIKSFSASFNDISILPKTCTFFASFHLENIYFSSNKIDIFHFSSFCRMNSKGTLRYVGFDHNRISVIDTDNAPLHQCFQPGALIELQGNMLSALDSWPMLLSQDKSIILDVSFNKLSEFTSSAGSFLSASQYGSAFIMTGNQIKHFMDVFNGWKVIVNTTKDLNTLMKNAYFDLSSNPLTCDCVDYEVYKYIQTLTTEEYDNLVCQEPLSLRGQNPYHIPLGEYVCAIDVKCPDGCTCLKVPHFQTVNVTCGSYNWTDIPEIVPDLPEQSYLYRLEICDQILSEILFRPYLWKTREIRLSNNSIRAIKFNSSNAFRNVQILHLDNNCLQRLPESVAGMTNDTAVEVRLGSNPWICDCEAIAMRNWMLLNLYIIKDHDVVLCNSPPSMVGVKVKDIDKSMVCPSENKTAVYVVAVISSAVFIYLVYLYISDRLKFAKWKFIGSDECDGEFKEFDVFMCGAVADSEYVEKYLIPELERRDFRVLYHLEHFDGGKPIHVNMSEAFEKSKRTLVFFSNNFKASQYSMFEFHSAYDLDIRKNTRRLITIKDTDLDMNNLDVSVVDYFERYTYIERESVRFWRLLENTLPRKRLGAQVRLEIRA